MPTHPTLYRFIACLRTTVVTDGIAITAAAEAGNLKARKEDKAREYLINSAKQLEEDYFEGFTQPSDVLLQAAAHFNNEKVITYLANVAESHQQFEDLRNEPNDSDNDADLLPDVDQALLDERQTALNDDPDLRDVDTTYNWVTSIWPSAASDTEIASQVIGRAEDVERVVAVLCFICYNQNEKFIALDNCEHLLCPSCYTTIQDTSNECPSCKKLMGAGPGNLLFIIFVDILHQLTLDKYSITTNGILGTFSLNGLSKFIIFVAGPGKVVNVGCLKFARQREAAANFGVSRDAQEAAANDDGQRPADVADRNYEADRHREAVAQAQRSLGMDSDDSDFEMPSRLRRTSPGPSRRARTSPGPSRRARTTPGPSRGARTTPGTSRGARGSSGPSRTSTPRSRSASRAERGLTQSEIMTIFDISDDDFA